MKKLSMLFVIIAGILWGTTGVFVRHYENLGLDSRDITMIRLFLAAVIFSVFLLFYNKKLFKVKLRDIGIFLGAGLLSLGVFSFCYFYTMQLTDLSVAATLLYTSPVFVVIFSMIFFKEKINIYKGIALLCALFGCISVTGVLSGNATISLTGFLFGILSGICYALYSIFSRLALNKNYSPMTIMFYSFLFSGVSFLFIGRPGKVIDIYVKTPTEIFYTILFVFVTAILPYFFYTFGLTGMKSSSASIIVSIELVVASLCGALIFKEAIPFPFGYIGIILILLSVVLVNLSDLKSNKNIKDEKKMTRLVELKNINKDLCGRIYAKDETENLTGSIKYRPAKYMLEDAIENGKIRSGGTIIEPTSGNMGIALAHICKEKNFKAIIVMPDNMSKERIDKMKEYGAEVVLTDSKYGMDGAVKKAKELNKETENSFIPSQFDNLSNSKAHYETTGPEIFKQMDKDIDIFISTIGTGGTITGTGKYLKEQSKDIKIIAVEPEKSPLLSKGYAGSHKIQGTGANFIPSVLDTDIYEEIIVVSDEDAYEGVKLLYQKENIKAGISSGAVLSAAIKVASKDENKDKKIVIILPDSYDRYESLEILS